MGMIIGPTPWWQSNLVRFCAVGCPLPDGSIIVCKAGGTAWIVAPNCTQVGATWNGTTTLLVGDKCCICDWATLNTRLLNCGFNPCDWFVPNISQLVNPGYCCRTQWDTFSSSCYWSSTEACATNAVGVCFNNGCGCLNDGCSKTFVNCVRAMRCVTY